MSALTNQTETDLLELMLTNADAPNWGDTGGLQQSVAPGSLYIGCHTGDALSDTSTAQNASECAYTGYSRQAVARSGAGWTISGDTGDNAALIQFGEASGATPETITDVGIGYEAGDPGYLHMWAQVAADLIVNIGVNPQYAIGALDITIN